MKPLWSGAANSLRSRLTDFAKAIKPQCLPAPVPPTGPMLAAQHQHLTSCRVAQEQEHNRSAERVLS